jgi:aminopeptidase N
MFLGRYIKSFFILYFSFFILHSPAQEKSVSYLYDAGMWPGERMIDATHLNAHIKIDPYNQTVEGNAAFTFKPLRHQLDSITFYTPDIRFNSITVDKVPVKYRSDNDQVIIYTSLINQYDSLHEIVFDYKAKSPSVLYFSGWDDPRGIKRKQVWTHRPMSWLPYITDRLTVDMYVTFDRKYKVFSNGVRVEVKENADGSKTWHYRMNRPHPLFSTALVIGDYDYKSSQTSKGLPLEYWYYPDQEDRVTTTYLYTEKMFDFFEDEMGLPYPWELYRQAPVVDYLYGAMETTTSTVFGDYMFVDERAFSGRSYVNTNAHELAHQWFGNYITHLASKDVWLTESFGTYYAKMFEKSVYGEDYYQNVRNNELLETMEAAAKDNYATGHSSGGRARWYPKGSLILDMLRYVMGDADFKTAVKYYLEHHPYQDAGTFDFFSSVYYSTGQPLDWFFEEWILRGGEPEYNIKYEKLKIEDDKWVTQVEVRQVHPVNELIKYFRMPIGFEVHYTDGSYDSKKEWVDGATTIVVVPNPGKKEVAYVLFDPNRQILKKVNFEKSFEELSHQALEATNMIDRYDALLALKNFTIDQKRDLFIKCYEKETYQLTRGEIIAQLAADHSPATMELMKKAIADEDPYVRRAVLTNIKNVPTDLKKDYETLLNDFSYINLELALENLVRSFPTDADRYLEITKNQTGWRGINIRIKWLELAIETGKKEYFDELVDYSSLSYEFETRQNALMALKRLNYPDERVTRNLFDAVLYWNFKLSNTAKDVLTYFMQQDQYKKLLTDYYHSHEWSDGQKVTLNKIFN